jgi:hypothetical protein
VRLTALRDAPDNKLSDGYAGVATINVGTHSGTGLYLKDVFVLVESPDPDGGSVEVADQDFRALL